MENLKQIIDDVIEGAFTSIAGMFENENGIVEGTRLCFPKYHHGGSKGKKRLCEQEFKQLFIEEFNKYCQKNRYNNLHYSVETPTVAGENSAGQSGNYDLTISEGINVKALIEFKAHNSDYVRDVKKLSNPEEKGVICFIVNILSASYDSTFKSIKDKIVEEYKKNNGTKTIYIMICSMHHHATGKTMIYKDEIKKQTK